MNFEEKLRVEIYTDFLRDSENPSPDTQILFKFTYSGTQVDWVNNEEENDDSRVEHARTRRIPDVELPVLLDRQQVICFEDARKTLDAILVELLLDDEERDDVIRGALEEAVDLSREVRGIEVGGVRVAVSVNRHRVYYGSRRDYDRLAGGEDQDHVFMIPTEDSVIESVKKRKRSVLESETCSICLENLPVCRAAISSTDIASENG